MVLKLYLIFAQFFGSLIMYLLLTVAIFAVSSAQERDKYCGLCSPESGYGDTANHTVCLYEGIGPACVDQFDSGVTEDDKQTILEVHNRFRAFVASGNETRGLELYGPQPPAANMMKLKWDEELARIAQLWADQCRFEHDCRHVEDFKVGQNIAQFWNDYAPIVQWKEVIEGWYEEVGNWSAADTPSFRYTGHEVMTAHYTQVVWGITRFVGCGRRAYRNGPFYVQHYVCNYGPAGNFWYDPLYAIGEPCSKCPEDSECSYDGILCEAGAGSKFDAYAHRYYSEEVPVTYEPEFFELNVTTDTEEENEVNTDSSVANRRLWEEWYKYMIAGNAQA